MSLSFRRKKLNLFSFLDLNGVFQQTETDNIFSMKFNLKGNDSYTYMYLTINMVCFHWIFRL